jgi:uncharacterized delta-60 repeat protein
MSNIARLMRMSSTSAPSEYWIGVLGGVGEDRVSGVVVDSADNIITCGYTNSAGAGNYDGIVVKYDPLGELLWGRVLGGAGNDQFAGVAVDSADNIITSGISYPPVARGDALTAKYDSSGTLLWSRVTGLSAGSNSMRFNSVAVDSNNDIVAVGDYVASLGCLIVKRSSSGAISFSRSIDGSSTSESFYSVAIDSSSNIIVVGYTFSNTAGSSDCLIGKYNSSGTQQWLRRLGGSAYDQFSRVAIDSSGNIFAVGFSASVVAGQFVGLIAKYNTSGTLLWVRRTGVNEFLVGVVADSNGDIVVVGGADSSGIVAKYNTSGALLWARALVGGAVSSVAIDSNDNIVAAGLTTVAGAGGNDWFIAKLPPDGSGMGTYGSFVYQVASITSVSTTLTDATLTFTQSSLGVVDAAATLTDSPAALEDQYFPVSV